MLLCNNQMKTLRTLIAYQIGIFLIQIVLACITLLKEVVSSCLKLIPKLIYLMNKETMILSHSPLLNHCKVLNLLKQKYNKMIENQDQLLVQRYWKMDNLLLIKTLHSTNWMLFKQKQKRNIDICCVRKINLYRKLKEQKHIYRKLKLKRMLFYCM